MQERLRIFFHLLLFWLCYMVVARIVFMAYNYDYSSSLTWTERALSMLHGLRMDASMTGYIMAASGLLLTLSVFKNSIWISKTLTFLTLSLLVLCTLLVTIDAELYRHWGFRMNTTPLMYIGGEAMGSIESLVYIRISLLFILIIVSFGFYFLKSINPTILYLGEAKVRSSIILLGLSALMFIPIRGSFTVAPMNTGFVFYHNSKPFANHSAINVVWNFLYDVRKSRSASYPENFFDKTATTEIFTNLHTYSDETINVLKNNKPNILFIILESFTADVIEPLGGLPGITPNLNKLCNEGVLFENFYSSGDRTDKGLISILSGYPAQPLTSIIKLPVKTQRLPQLNQHMRRLGYHTSFIYGGDIDFANFRSYLNTSGFHHLTTLDDFDSELYTSKWGVHDHFMFDRAQQELDSVREPFFKVILTLSSHEPFDVPMEPFVKGSDHESLFVNSCHYTDKSLGKFIDYCKTQTWWANTLLVITADHGHRHPGNKAIQDKERFRIPFLLSGGAIRKDTVISTIGNQVDIANTLLGQLDKPVRNFTFSKNLLAKDVRSFAAYFFNDGYGFITNDAYIVHDNAGKQFIRKEGATDNDLDLSKAYQQMLYTNYNNIDKK